MSKSSLDYTELAGLNIALAALKHLPKLSEKECIVLQWLEQRVKELELK